MGKLVNALTTAFQDVAALPGGGFVGVWESGEGLVWREFTDNGQAAGGKVLVAPLSMSPQSASIAVQSDGSVAVAFVQEGGGPYEYWLAIYDAAGSQTGLVPINFTDLLRGTPIDVRAVDDGGFTVAWSKDANVVNDTDELSFGFTEFSADGSLERSVSHLVYTYDDEEPRPSDYEYVSGTTLPLSGGNYVVVTTSGAGAKEDLDVSAVLYGSHGDVIVEIERLNSGRRGIETNVVAEPLADGGFVVVWEEKRTFPGGRESTTLHGRVVDSSGDIVGDEFAIGGRQAEGASIAALDDGRFVVAWTDTNAAGNADVLAQEFDSAGGKIGGEVPLNNFSAANQSNVRLFTLEDGLVLGLWQESLAGAPSTTSAIFEWDTVFSGSPGADVLIGSRDGDLIYAFEGDDLLIGGPGGDILDGGPGFDLVSYDYQQEDPVFADLLFRDANQGDAAGDTFISIEALAGTDFDDRLAGSGKDNIIWGGEGNDRVQGRAGSDTLDGEAGNDELQGEDGDDLLLGGGGDDILRGGAGDDVLVGASGADVLDGGDGFDIASYDHGAGGTVQVDLLDPTANTGEAAGDTFVFIEAVAGSDSDDGLAGSDEADTLWGGEGHDQIRGRSGSDALYGDEGDDYLNGGAGHDLLVGGAGSDGLEGGEGADTFRFRSVSDSPKADGFGNEVIDDADIIVDFSTSDGDVIDLSSIDANAGLQGNNAFDFIGEASFSGAAGELRYFNSTISADVDGDAEADLLIVIANSADFAEHDFIL